jgi:hypothetical protein
MVSFQFNVHFLSLNNYSACHNRTRSIRILLVTRVKGTLPYLFRSNPFKIDLLLVTFLQISSFAEKYQTHSKLAMNGKPANIFI